MAPGRLEQLTGDIERRDTMDSTRAISPLKEAADAVRIDTTDLTFDEQVEAVVERAKPYFPTA
jgi:cytidylate kinase